MSNKKIADIKDKTPSDEVIKRLEVLLEKAKNGDLRSILTVEGYSDNTVVHNWSIDPRTSFRMFLADIVMTQFDLSTRIALRDGDSILANELNS